MADLGYLAIVLSFALSIYGLLAVIIGAKKGNHQLLASARGATTAIAILVTVASAILFYLLAKSDFSIEYVWQYTSSDLSIFLKLSAFWAGNAGSMLLWAWILGIYTAIVASSRRFQERLGIPYVTAVLLINNVFFLFLLTFVSNPFAKIAAWPPPTEGNGLNPLLRSPGMIFHPVNLYLGYVGFAVPYAFAMGALLTRHVDDLWIKVTRRWTVVAWMFLSLGNLYGAQWAYMELGWGGFWGWDPVENASFIPWLTGTAFLHSVMIQERKDMLKVWNMVLIIITYLLTLFGTFLVRSGILTSVHAFAGSNLGPFFLMFIGFMLAFSLYLLLDRLPLLKEEREFESFVSRESSFLLNNLLLVGAAFATFWGTVFPLLSEAVRGVKVTVSVPYFNRVNGPILLAMLFIMGVCPLIAWQRSSLKNLRANFLGPLVVAVATGVVLALLLPAPKPGAVLGWAVAAFVLATIVWEFIRGTAVRRRLTGESLTVAFWRMCSRNRRRYGGYVIHAGIVLMAIAVVGSGFYMQEVTKTVSVGDKLTIGGYTLTYQGLDARQAGNDTIVYARLLVDKDGKRIGTVEPQKISYGNWPEMTTEVAVLGGWKEDLYVILSAWENYGQQATFEVHVNPLVRWLWVGNYVLILGTIFAVWPSRGPELQPKYVRVAAQSYQRTTG